MKIVQTQHEAVVDLVLVAKDLLEICRIKCSPTDEVWRRDGISNEQVMIAAERAIHEAEHVLAHARAKAAKVSAAKVWEDMMKVNNETMYVVWGDGGVTQMNLSMLIDAVNGGLKLSETLVFTTAEEAHAELSRRQMVARGTAILRGLGLEDLEGAVKSLEELVPLLLDRTMTKVLG